MKSLKLTLIICLFSSSFASGQNYQTVISNRISFFEGPYRSIECIRLDSVKFQTDSTLYPFSNIQQTEDGCFTPFGDSWIGAKIIKKENGINIYFNRNHDSIIIKTNAVLNDSWTVYYLPDSIKIIATVTSHDTMSFLGQLDSVKILGFQVYDKNMNLLDYLLNNMELKISKNFGFVKTFNFYLFPNFTKNYESVFLAEYSLIGLSNPKIGIQNLTWFEINDFQPGDELHIVNESSSWGGYLRREKIICKYLSRSDYDDSIEYAYSYWKDYYVISPDTSYENYTNGITKQITRLNPDFDKLPGEPVVDRDYRAYFYSMGNGSVLSKMASFLEIFRGGNDSCWNPLIIDGCYPEFNYLKGLGGPYYECDEFTSKSFHKLVYYKKGDITWGTPLIITGIQDRLDEENILVFQIRPGNIYLSRSKIIIKRKYLRFLI